jgi:ribonuclease HI
MKKKYYAVKVGKTPGIYETWEECSANVTGFPGAIYKSFGTIEEAEAFAGISTKDEEQTDQGSELKGPNIESKLIEYLKGERT